MYGKKSYSYAPLYPSEQVNVLPSPARYGSIGTPFTSECSYRGTKNVNGMVNVETKTWCWLVSSLLCAVCFFSVVILLVSKNHHEPENIRSTFGTSFGLPEAQLTTSVVHGERFSNYTDLKNKNEAILQSLPAAAEDSMLVVPKSWVTCGPPGKKDLMCCINVLCSGEMAELMVKPNNVVENAAPTDCLQTSKGTVCTNVFNRGNPLMDCLEFNNCISKPNSCNDS